MQTGSASRLGLRKLLKFIGIGVAAGAFAGFLGGAATHAVRYEEPMPREVQTFEKRFDGVLRELDACGIKIIGSSDNEPTPTTVRVIVGYKKGPPEIFEVLDQRPNARAIYEKWDEFLIRRNKSPNIRDLRAAALDKGPVDQLLNTARAKRIPSSVVAEMDRLIKEYPAIKKKQDSWVWKQLFRDFRYGGKWAGRGALFGGAIGAAALAARARRVARARQAALAGQRRKFFRSTFRRR